jgi:DNA-binding NtrC family response regulator
VQQDESGKIAIVDDYQNVAETIATYVSSMGYTPVVYTNPLEFLDALKETAFELLITDIRMPQMDGIALLKKVKRRAPKIEVIVVSAHAEKADAIEALKHGAFDFFEKPVSEWELVTAIKRTIGYKHLVQERDALAQQLSVVSAKEANKWGVEAFVGTSPAMAEIVQRIRLLQKSRNTNVLILGESGTGKELVAKAIHFGSERAASPFVAVNCSAIPADLAESVLFGHIKGSFTGAITDQRGKFEVADGGTLFLDEIGDMPALVQTKILRVLEDGVVIPVGKADGKRVDVRVVSATNMEIQDGIISGKFRADLYHRLAAYVVTSPPLRDRKQDLPALVRHFVSMLSGEMGIAEPKAEKSFIDSLKGYKFPGNIRELKNIIERAIIDAAGKDLSGEHLLGPSTEILSKVVAADVSQIVASGADSPPFNLQENEKIMVRRAVDHVRGNIAEASRLLGISRAKVYRILG